MKVLVVHDSKYGCGKKVAELIAAGIRKGGHGADVVHAKGLKAAGPAGFDAYVIGSPTHANGPTFRIGGSIKAIGKAGRGRPFATFTTFCNDGKDTLRKMEGKAERAGLRRLVTGRAFRAMEMKGPLAEGVTEEAEGFGSEIAGALSGKIKTSARAEI